MDKKRWSKIKNIFDHICDETPSFRRDYLDMVCADDDDLRRELEAILIAHDNMPGKLSQPIVALDKPIPKRIGQYDIHEVLGSGAMSTVHRAVHPRHGEVAVKILPRWLLRHPDIESRFFREVEILRRLSHPAMGKIHEVIRSQDFAAIAMQRLAGETLEDVISNAHVPIEQTLGIGVAIADVLALAHRNGIVHRDIKPTNIILGRTGETYVIDFGIAKLEGTRLTRTGQMIGSPKYMSPEQWRGEDVDFRSDIWSLGIVLYQLCVGDVPFRGSDHASIARAVLSPRGALDSDAVLEQNAPPPLARLITGMLEKDPGLRPQSMESIRDELAGLITA